MSSSPWNKIEPPKETNFQDIMSEQLAQDLQLKEDLKAITTTFEENKETVHTEYEIPKEILEELQKDEHYDSDATIAKMLQNQFDKEHDEMLKREEKKYNRSSKVQISFSKYRTVPDNLLYDDSDQEEAEDPEDKKDWDRFETVEKEFNAIPRCGYKVKEGNLITKHDMTMSGRRNAGKVMSFPPEFQTGDGAGFDMRLSNKVFNSLKVYSRLEQSRSKKIHDKREDHATAEMGVDEPTRLLLYKLINNEILERINGVISTGKEAVVLHAENGTSCELPFKECAVKVFKTTLNEFKTRDKYIKDDFRFKDRFSKQNPRKIIHLWAEKEMHNLIRIKNVGIPCPEVVCLKKHILVMSFIGENCRAAPKLKDTVLSFEDLCDAYEQILEIVTKLYSEAKLIHADFSEYNVLWHDGKCWLIDVSQAVEHSHPTAYEFLLRDCGNISTFFTKKGIPDVKSAEDLFTLITGLDARTAIETLNKNKKDKPHLVDRPDHQESYNFDYIWEKCKEQKNECLETSNLNKDKCLNVTAVVEPVAVVE